jgi:hypothetical protein
MALGDPFINIPSGTRPATFESDSEYHHNVQLPQKYSEISAAALAMSLNSVQSTSTTSMLIGTGAKTLTTQVNKGYLPGMNVRVVDVAAPTSNYVNAIVTSYVVGTGVLQFTVLASNAFGAGTLSNWSIFFIAEGSTSASFLQQTIQNQSASACTTSGTAPTFVATLSPAYITSANFQKFDITFHAANNGVACTLNPNGRGAMPIKQTDYNGNLINPTFPAGFKAVLEDNGAGSLIIKNPLYSNGRLNRVINSKCKISQLGAVAVINTAFVFGGCDRFPVQVAGTTSSGTIQQINGIGFRADSAQAVTTTTTGSATINIQQRIEASNSIDLNSKTVTASAWVYHDVGSNINVSMLINKPTSTINVFSAQTNIATGTSVSVASATWTQVFVTYTLGATEASLGLASSVQFSAGAVTAKTFYISDMSFSVGTEVQFLSSDTLISKDVVDCRYYLRTLNFGTYTFYNAAGAGYSLPISIGEPMRVTPIVGSFAVSAQTNITGTVAITPINNQFVTLGGGTATALGACTITQSGNAILNSELFA